VPEETEPELIVIVKPLVEAVCGVGVVESVAVIVTEVGPPAVVGVPVMAPVLVLMDRPAGRLVDE
jgi:hypothetical protein